MTELSTLNDHEERITELEIQNRLGTKNDVTRFPFAYPKQTRPSLSNTMREEEIHNITLFDNQIRELRATINAQADRLALTEGRVERLSDAVKVLGRNQRKLDEQMGMDTLTPEERSELLFGIT